MYQEYGQGILDMWFNLTHTWVGKCKSHHDDDKLWGNNEVFLGCEDTLSICQNCE